VKQVLIEYQRTDQQYATDAHVVTTEEANRIKAFLEQREHASKFLIVVSEGGRESIYNPTRINAMLVRTIEDETPISEGQGQKSTKAGRKKGS
jgi:hypothetical protein